jgi:hypothetical protein
MSDVDSFFGRGKMVDGSSVGEAPAVQITITLAA